MGYQTYHTLTVTTADQEQHLAIIAEFRSEYEDAEYSLSEEGDPETSTKWYEAENDLCEFSKKHPEHLFLLEGEGEEAGDLWKWYVKNGKIQHCHAEIVYPEFDESKMV